MSLVDGEKLKICLVSEKFPIVGKSFGRGFISPIARGLSKAGHQVSVIAWDNPIGEKEWEQEGIRIHFVSGANPRRMELFPRRGSAMQTDRYHEQNVLSDGQHYHRPTLTRVLQGRLQDLA